MKQSKTFVLLMALLTQLFCVQVVPASPVVEKSLAATQEKKQEVEVSPIEDLMREHGVLNRILLIYEEIKNRLDENIKFPINTLQEAVGIMQRFIENYHEKLEENYIFPLFEKAGKETELVATLRKQHERGRVLSGEIVPLATAKKVLSPANRKQLSKLLQEVICMFRIHETREDTVLFPQVRALVTEKAYDRLGDLFEEQEEKLFGKNGFERIVAEVASIEKELEIYDLNSCVGN